MYTNYVLLYDLLYYEREKSNAVGTVVLIGEVNALSVLSNEIRDGKSKERKEISTVSSSKRPREDIRSFFSAIQKIAKATQEASRVIEIDDND